VVSLASWELVLRRVCEGVVGCILPTPLRRVVVRNRDVAVREVMSPGICLARLGVRLRLRLGVDSARLSSRSVRVLFIIVMRNRPRRQVRFVVVVMSLVTGTGLRFILFLVSILERVWLILE